ncbi:hypothetical protein DUNSADRAFT_4594, partial [Dunaliella salina]
MPAMRSMCKSSCPYQLCFMQHEVPDMPAMLAIYRSSCPYCMCFMQCVIPHSPAIHAIRRSTTGGTEDTEECLLHGLKQCGPPQEAGRTQRSAYCMPWPHTAWCALRALPSTAPLTSMGKN